MWRPIPALACFVLAATCAAGVAPELAAEPAKKPTAAPAAKSAQGKDGDAAPAPTATAQATEMPDAYRLNLLIRTTVIAINQANQTNNYTVLRDLASPGFQKANSVEKLRDVFAGLRKNDLDLSPILFFDPKLIQQPTLLNNGMLRLIGFFDTRPRRVHFDFIFEEAKGDWRLFAVNIGTREATPETASSGAPAGSAAPGGAPGAAPAGAAAPAAAPPGKQ
jgi:hypothetical protein